MKKIILSISCALLFGSASWAQSEKIVSQLDATKSTGFLKWENTDNLGYKIRVFKKLGIGELQEVFETESTKNFVKLEKELLKKDHFYRIEGKSTGTLDVVIIDDVQPIITPVPGVEFGEPRCYATCNGPNYSWRLTAYEKFVFEYDDWGNLISESTDQSYMSISPNPGYYDAQGNYTSNYMMMDLIDLEWYKVAHQNIFGGLPVEKCSGSPCSDEWDYFYVSDLPANHGYRNMNGHLFPGRDGYLVKKTLFKYNWMNGNRTDDLPNSSIIDNLCNLRNSANWNNAYSSSANVASWTNVFNSSSHELNHPYPSTNTSFHLQNLNCISTPLPGNNGTFGNNTGNGSNNDTDIHAYFDCVQDFVFTNLNGEGASLNCFKDISIRNPNGNGGGNTGNGVGSGSPFDEVVNDGPLKVIFTKVDSNEPSEEVIWTPRQESEFYMPDNIPLEQGLYSALFIFKGQVIPIYFESTAENTPVYKISDFVSAQISPNPVQGGIVNLDVNSTKKVKYNLQAFNLNGDILHTEQGVLNAGQTKNLKINVNKNQAPFNQVRVKMTFDDGSVIEKTALI
jgi:hypothetical protein